ncbi:MAG: sulfotransferase [Cyanobacteria bacterium P01_A01_bin.114]
MKTVSDPWMAPPQATLPDFMIVGAMKAGTSTIHQMLNQHPDVFIPDAEIHFFDIDDIFEHSDFFLFRDGQWITPDIEKDSARFWDWYASFFAKAQAGQLMGEDSTVYLASEKAIKRIARQQKEIKLIVLLRQPTLRAYSQYLHLLRTGRATGTFEAMIETRPHVLLKRSLYSEQIKVLFQHLPAEQIKIVIFEEFLIDKDKTLKDLCDFLGLAYQRLPPGTASIHANKTKTPKYFELQLLKNRFFRGQANTIYADHLPMTGVCQGQGQARLGRAAHKVYRWVNPSTEQKPAAIKEPTRQFLDAFFQKELSELNTLIQKDVTSLWFG